MARGKYNSSGLWTKGRRRHFSSAVGHSRFARHHHYGYADSNSARVVFLVIFALFILTGFYYILF